MIPQKTKHPRAAAIAVARELVQSLAPYCDRLIVAGSLRRRKSEVGDVEILYVSKLETIPELRQPDLLSPTTEIKFKILADCWINYLAGYYHDAATDKTVRRPNYIITQRRTLRGSTTWGKANKLASHIASGIPVDFFRATEDNWWNMLVCRTGSADNNTRICMAAQSKGWKWKPYCAGFTDQEGNLVRTHSEEDVFRLVGLPYLQPWER